MTAHLIRGAQLVDGTRADIRLQGTRITAVGSGLDADGATVTDADGSSPCRASWTCTPTCASPASRSPRRS